MKKIILSVILVLFFFEFGFTQSQSYFSSGGEMIFSFATIDDNGNSDGSILRWSPVFNWQGMYNYDLNDNIGLFTGLAIRNVGYIYNNYMDKEGHSVKKKFRTYNLGIPVGFKIGNLKKAFLYAGYDIEFPFHYKEKTFKDENKTKTSVWFSDRVEQFQHGFMVGIQLPYGANIKFKYYLSEFHNQSYTESDGYKPYENLSSNIFYISLNYNLFTNTKEYMGKGKKSEYF
jgi:hypothetical protein